MSFTITTPFMNLILPEPTLELGPAWAVELNAALGLVDSHNHSPGQGVPIGSTSLNINADLPFNSFNLTSVRSVRFQSQSSPLSLSTDLAAIYVANGNLYYNNLSGQQVQITAGASLNAAAIGGIGGDYATSGALVFYTSATSTYSFTTDGTNYANMNNAAVTIFPVNTNTFGITLLTSNSQATSYTITLPLAPPSVQTVITMTNSGQLLAGIPGGTASDVSPGFGLIPTGAVVPYFGTSAPAGYLMCDGSSYLQTTFAALFAVIGTSCGTADGTHFNVPDLRGQFLRGVTGTSSNDPDTSSRTAMNTGGNTGNNVGSIQPYQIQNHSHTFSLNGNVPGNTNFAASSNSPQETVGTTTTTGGNETRPINAYCNYIIKT